jgi:hypothetical protein
MSTDDMMPIIRMLATVGVLCLAAAGALYVFGRFGGSYKMPGDIMYRRGNFTVYFPIVSCILLSLLLTLISFIMRYLRK